MQRPSNAAFSNEDENLGHTLNVKMDFTATTAICQSEAKNDFSELSSSTLVDTYLCRINILKPLKQHNLASLPNISLVQQNATMYAMDYRDMCYYANQLTCKILARPT